MSNSPGKNIIITGGARGIGRVVARHLLSSPAASHHVYILDVNADELGYCAKTHLGEFYHANRLSYAVVDLTNPTAVRSAIHDAATSFFPDKRIDVLVNNAGIAKPIWANSLTMEDEQTLEEWNKYLATNLTAPFLTSQAVIPFMKEPPSSTTKAGLGPNTPIGGCIVNVSSFRAHLSDPDSEPYAATKAGLLGLTHAMAVSAQRWNIRVNSILPGFISVKHESKDGDEGKNTPHSWEEEHGPEDPVHTEHPVNRIGQGEDIAGAVEYLMGAGFVTGQELIVDGGISIKKGPKV